MPCFIIPPNAKKDHKYKYWYAEPVLMQVLVFQVKRTNTETNFRIARKINIKSGNLTTFCRNIFAILASQNNEHFPVCPVTSISWQ